MLKRIGFVLAFLSVCSAAFSQTKSNTPIPKFISSLQSVRVRSGIQLPTSVIVYGDKSEITRKNAENLSKKTGFPLASDREVNNISISSKWSLLKAGWNLIVVGDSAQNSLTKTLSSMNPVNIVSSSKGSIFYVKNPFYIGYDAYVLRGEDDAGLLSVSNQFLLKLKPVSVKPEIAVWNTNLINDDADPTQYRNLIYPIELPASPSHGLSFYAMVNERAKQGLAVTAGLSKQPIQLQAKIGELKSSSGKKIPSQQIKVLYADYIKAARSGLREPDPLPDASSFVIPSGETRWLWLIVDATDVQPGIYRGFLTLTNPQAGILKKIPIAVNIYPITLAKKNDLPIYTTVWEHTLSTDSMIKKFHFDKTWKDYYDDLAEHGVNVIQIHPHDLSPIYAPAGKSFNEDRIREYVKYAFSHGFKYFLVQLCYNSKDYYGFAGNSKPGDPEWNAAYKKLVAEYVKFIKNDLKLDYSQWALYPVDEPGSEELRHNLIVAAKLAKEVDPNIKIWTDPGAYDSLRDSIDIFCPHIKTYGDPDSREWFDSLNKPLWIYTYNDYGVTRSHMDLNRAPDRMYRMMPWRAWNWNMKGYGIWAYQFWSGDPWSDEDGQDASFVYYDKKTYEPVTSINWEAYSEGVDDYKTLCKLKESSNFPGVAELLQQAPKVVEEPWRADAFRTKALKLLYSEYKAKNALNPIIKVLPNIPDFTTLAYNGNPIAKTSASTMAATTSGSLLISNLPTLTAVRTTIPIDMDGKLDDLGWVNAAVRGAKFSGFVVSGGQSLAKEQTEGYVVYDDANLYIAITAHLSGERPQDVGGTAKDSSVWEHDSFELFFDPTHDHMNYLQFAVDAAGGKYDGKNGNVEWNADWEAACSSDKTSWTAEIRVPWSSLGVYPTKGKILGSNFCNNSSFYHESSSWSCTFGPFDTPQKFGSIVLQ